jgi:hypothetical protein
MKASPLMRACIVILMENFDVDDPLTQFYYEEMYSPIDITLNCLVSFNLIIPD